MSFEKDAVVLEKNKRLATVAVAAAVVVAIGTLAKAFVFGGTPEMILLAALPIGIASRVWKENWRARPRRARVSAGPEGVFVDGVRAVSPFHIAHGHVQPRAGKKPSVRLRGKRGNLLIEIEVVDDAEGIALLRAVNQDASARKASFRTMSPFFATRGRSMLSLISYAVMAALIITVVFVLAGFGDSESTWAGILALVPVVVAIRGRQADVGADGLSLTWNRMRRFIRWDEVEAVEPREIDAVVVKLHDGERIPLRTGGSSGWDGGERAMLLRDAFLRRIVEAMEAHRANIGPRDLAAQLASAGRDENAWLADLKKLRGAETHYRAAAVREDDLWRVVEDPGAPEEARAAAAVLLRGVENARPRLRVAAEAVASPKLRVALEAEEEQEAEEALKAYLRK